MKVKELWKNNPVLLLVFVSLTIALLVLVWGWLGRFYNWATASIKGVGSSLSKDEAQAIAQNIYGEVNSIWTDEDRIVSLVKVLSLADYFKVKAEFGIQPYSNTFDNFDSLTGVDSNLTEVLNQTLSTSDKQKIKQANPELPIT